MRLSFLRVVCVACVLAMTGCRKEPETLIRGGYDEKEMEKAIQRAKSELPEFLDALRARAGTDFAVKAPIRDGEKVEHIWVTGVVLRGNEFQGEIGNEAGIVKGITLGQKWSVKTNEVSDWLYMKGETMHGNYTMRPLLETMDPAEARAWRKRFAKP